MTVGLRHRPPRTWQPQGQFAQRRPSGEPVDHGAARFGEAEPDAAIEAVHEVVRIARQIIEQHLCEGAGRGLREV